MSVNQEDMHKAFQQFMLKGKGPTTIQQQLKTPSPSNKKSPAHNKSATKKRQLYRKYYQMFQSFCRSIQDEWMDIDSQLDSVLSSILNLRLRIPKETKLLERLGRKASEEEEWMTCGYRSRRGGVGGRTSLEGGSSENGMLQISDVELAISHDIIQHERMLSATRNLLANWGECQEAIGRKLDNLMTAMMDDGDNYSYDENDAESDSKNWASQQQEWLEGMTDIYQMCSMELYRKQCLCQSGLLSVGDKVLSNEEGLSAEEEKHFESMGGGICPRRAISRCCKEWPVSCKKSCMDMMRLNEVLRMASLDEEEKR